MRVHDRCVQSYTPFFCFAEHGHASNRRRRNTALRLNSVIQRTAYKKDGYNLLASCPNTLEKLMQNNLSSYRQDTSKEEWEVGVQKSDAAVTRDAKRSYASAVPKRLMTLASAQSVTGNWQKKNSKIVRNNHTIVHTHHSSPRTPSLLLSRPESSHKVMHSS